MDISLRASTSHEIYPIHQSTERRRIPDHLENHASISQDLHASIKQQTKNENDTGGQGLLDPGADMEDIVGRWEYACLTCQDHPMVHAVMCPCICSRYPDTCENIHALTES